MTLVVAKNDSNLAIARLLRPQMEQMRACGSLLGRQKISALLQRYRIGGVFYGAREVKANDAQYMLDIQEYCGWSSSSGGRYT